jgi:enterobactin synthetase component D
MTLSAAPIPDASVLLPTTVRSRFLPLPAAATRFTPLELPAHLSNAVPRRQLEYLAGRECARQALRDLGYAAAAAVGADADRVPLWPAGVTGSISHTDDVAWAAVVNRGDVLGLGVDVERLIAPDRARTLEHLIIGPLEGALADAAGFDRATFLSIAFSFKESIFKCVFPLTRTFFGYREATVVAFDPEQGRIRAQLNRTVGGRFRAGEMLEGRYVCTRTHVYTSVCVSAGSTPATAGRSKGRLT